MKRTAIWLVAAATLMAGCHRDMWIQPKAKAQSESQFFTDGKNSRPNVEGAVPFGDADKGSAFMTGYQNGRLVAEMPVKVTKEMVKRGQERYQIFCTHCHGAVGDGQGMIAQRGLTMAQPVASYHTDRLRSLPDGHIFDVITNGYGTMYPFSDRIPVEDRWAIVAYVRTLQLSQYMPASQLSSEQRANVVNPPKPVEEKKGHKEGGH